MAITAAKKPVLHVAICTPTAGLIHAAYCMSLTRMILHFLQTPVRADEYGAKRVTTHMYVGANIAENRDKMCDTAIEIGASHLLFIDDDMGFMPECLNMALERSLPIVLANYRRKNPPGYFTAYEANDTIGGQEIITTEDSTSMVPCYNGGFGFCLIETDVLKQLPKPRFLNGYLEEVGRYTTEDWPFFGKVRELKIPAFVDQEVSKRVWHNGTFAYSFDQDLDPRWALPYAERQWLKQYNKEV